MRQWWLLQRQQRLRRVPARLQRGQRPRRKLRKRLSRHPVSNSSSNTTLCSSMLSVTLLQRQKLPLMVHRVRHGTVPRHGRRADPGRGICGRDAGAGRV